MSADNSAFERLCDAVDQGLALARRDGEHLRLLYANDRLRELLGVRPGGEPENAAERALHDSGLWTSLERASRDGQERNTEAAVADGQRHVRGLVFPTADGAGLVLDSRGDDLAEMVHALNNPLMVLRAISELFRMHFDDHGGLDPELGDLLDRLDGTTGRLTQIVKGLRGPASPEPRSPVPKGTGQRLSGTILVADDDPDLLSVLSFLLASLGLEVETVAHGDAALASLKRRSYDYLLTDQRMPGIAGETLIERAIPHLSSTRCFLMTGWTESSGAPPDTMTVGSITVGVIPKPVSRESLLARLSR